MQIHQLNLGLKSQILMRSGATRGQWNELSLEEVRDEVRGQARVERTEDRTVRLSDCRLEFESDGRAYIRYRGRSRFGRPQPITTDALLQIARMVTRPSSFTLFEDLVLGGEPGDLKLATRVFQRMVSRKLPERKVLCRTAVRTIDGVKSKRVTLAVLSRQYRVFDDADFLDSLLSSVPQASGRKVISAVRTSSGLSLRMSRAGTNLAELPVATPVPMVELRNSEIGQGSTAVASGLFTLLCTNGMHQWKSDSVYRWPHRSGAGDVREELPEALEHADLSALAAQDDYRTGTEITVGTSSQEVSDWLQHQNRRVRLSQRLIAGIVAALEDSTISRAEGGELTVASVVDAMTLHAQSEPFAQRYELERLAGRVLHGAIVEGDQAA